MYSKTAMLTYFQVSRPRKIKVRVVKAHEHVPYLSSKNVVDTRKKTKSIFGTVFFADINEKQLDEYDRWQRLARKLKRNIIK